MPKKSNKHLHYNPRKSPSHFTVLNINQKLYSKYNSSQITYGIKKVDELIYIDSTLFSITFREFLLYDDPTEFLRRFYSKKEQPAKLGKILFFYEKYSRIFPNYTILSGSKYMYKNIQKKQKMIDNLQELKQQEAENKKHSSAHVTILNNTAVNTILNESNSFCIKTLNMMFNINIGNNKHCNNNNSLQDIERLLKEINNAEERELHNRTLSPRVLIQNSIALKQEIEKIRFTSRENSTTRSKEQNRVDNNSNSNNNNNHHNININKLENEIDIENIKNNISTSIQSRTTSHQNQNRILSLKGSNFNYSNFKNITHNSILNGNKMFLHKKTNSQNVNQYITKKTGNASVKNKILSLEKKTSEFVEHMKQFKKPETAKYSNYTSDNNTNHSNTNTKYSKNSKRVNNNNHHEYKDSTRLTYNVSNIKSDLSSSWKLSPAASLGKITNIGRSKHGIPLNITNLTKQTQSSMNVNGHSKANTLNLCFVTTPKNSCFTERESSKRLTFVNTNHHHLSNSNNNSKPKIEGRNIFPTNYFYYSNFSCKSSRTNSQEKTIGFSSPSSKRRNVIATTTNTDKVKFNNYFVKRKNRKMLIKENQAINNKGEISTGGDSNMKYINK
jgi:hypothetical protein